MSKLTHKASPVELAEQHIRARRFLVKVVSEASQLKATQATLEKQADQTLVTLADKNGSKKIVKVGCEWFALLPQFLRENWFCLDEKVASENFDYMLSNTFQSGLRLGTQFVSLRVQLAPERVKLFNFEHLSVSSLGDIFHLDSVSRNYLKEFESRLDGLLLIAANTNECLYKARCSWTALSSCQYIGELKNQLVRKSLPGLVGKDLWAAGFLAEDPASALSQLHSFPELLALETPIYLTFNSFPKALCTDCPGTMRLAVNQFILDSKYNQREWKSQTPSADQLCGGCAGYGYQGWEGACQIIEVDAQLRAIIAKNSPASEIDAWLTARGWPRFYDLTVELALDGKTDIAALHVCGFSKVNSNDNAVASLPVEDDFFEVLPEGKHNPSNSFKPETQILVVEDDLDQRQILEIALQDMGYSVLLAENGLEALGLLQTNQPNLIITDLMMPKMNGMDFVKNIKAEDRFKDIGVMVLTVLNDPDKEYSLLDLGVEDYCEKTTPRKVLLKRIENLAKRKVVQRAANSAAFIQSN